MSEGKRFVVGFVFSPDLRTVILLRKTRPEWQAGKLNGMGGRVELGETYLQAMHREGQEESGMDWPWEHFATMRCRHERHAGNEIAFFRAVSHEGRRLVGRVNDVGEKFGGWDVDVITQGMAATIPNLQWLLPMAAAENDRHDWPYLLEEKAAPRADMEVSWAPW